MERTSHGKRKADVALLAEGVDRNIGQAQCKDALVRSPSSRRAWIEIMVSSARTTLAAGRPPRGGRG